jgi:hypothetical protein
MAENENNAARAQKVRKAIQALEEALAVAREYLHQLEREERTPDVDIEHFLIPTCRASDLNCPR